MFVALLRAVCALVVLVALVVRAESDGRGQPAPSDAEPAFEAADATWPGPPPGEPIRYASERSRRVYRVTAYCDRGLTASGVPAGEGQCAAPANVPFGAKVYIPALGRTLIVTDRTARRFRRNTIDVFLPDRAACLEFGRSYLTCEITLPHAPPRYASARLQATLAEILD